LSGGEQQRVALLRALANDPEIIIGDEPTGNLDSKTGTEILDMLIKLRKDSGKTLIIVTHDSTIADRAEEVVVLKDGVMMRDQRIHKEIYAN
jgi:putative ABC transport system ATP-binding protein